MDSVFQTLMEATFYVIFVYLRGKNIKKLNAAIRDCTSPRFHIVVFQNIRPLQMGITSEFRLVVTNRYMYGLRVGISTVFVITCNFQNTVVGGRPPGMTIEIVLSCPLRICMF